MEQQRARATQELDLSDLEEVARAPRNVTTEELDLGDLHEVESAPRRFLPATTIPDGDDPPEPMRRRRRPPRR